MIEKLDKDCGKLQKKINELVDAVNELQLAKDVMFNRIDRLNDAMCDMRIRITALEDPTYHEESKTPADPYEKERRWIGKLCWFWSGNFKQCGILTAVLDNNKYGDADPTEEYPFQRDSIGCWQHCKPVLPDDDIIYKGGDNE